MFCHSHVINFCKTAFILMRGDSASGWRCSPFMGRMGRPMWHSAAPAAVRTPSGRPQTIWGDHKYLSTSSFLITLELIMFFLWQFPINPCDYTALGLHSAVSFLKLVDWLCWLGYWSEGWWITLIQIVSYFSCSDIVDYFTYPLANKSGYMIPTFWLFCFEFEIRTMLLYLW